MIFLNIIYGLIMAVCMAVGRMFYIDHMHWNWIFFFAIWGGWTTAHCLQDVAGYWLVRFFNRDKIITRANFPRS